MSSAPPPPTGEVMPVPGRTPSLREKTMIRTNPNQNEGRLSPTVARTMVARSMRDPRRAADITPMAIPTANEITIAPLARRTVWPKRWTTSSSTGRRRTIDSPRFPRRTLPIQRRYWTCTGRSRPSWRRKAWTDSSPAAAPAMILAGSPGVMWIMPKTRIETPKSTANMDSRRRIRYCATELPSCLCERTLASSETHRPTPGNRTRVVARATSNAHCPGSSSASDAHVTGGRRLCHSVARSYAYATCKTTSS